MSARRAPHITVAGTRTATGPSNLAEVLKPRSSDSPKMLVVTPGVVLIALSATRWGGIQLFGASKIPPDVIPLTSIPHLSLFVSPKRRTVTMPASRRLTIVGP